MSDLTNAANDWFNIAQENYLSGNFKEASAAALLGSLVELRAIRAELVRLTFANVE